MKQTPNLELVERVARSVIHRINYPKRACGARKGKDGVWRSMSRLAALNAKSRPLLSEWDEEDVRQVCALVLHGSGALYSHASYTDARGEQRSGRATLQDWRDCFTAARVLLRIERKFHEDAYDLAKLGREPLSYALTSDAKHSPRRRVIARNVRYQRDLIRAAFTADNSRQRAHNRRKAMRFLRYLTSNARVNGLGYAEVSTADNQRDVLAAYRKYTARGEEILTAQSLANVKQDTYSREEQLTRSFAREMYSHLAA